MRRGLGVGGIAARAAETRAAAALGAASAASDAAHVAAQLSAFRDALARFVAKHRSAINADPAFRAAFARMARSAGVDPLAAPKGGVWSALGLGDFYAGLAVQLVDAVLASRAADGGLTSLAALTARLRAMRGPAAGALDEGDVRRAVDALAGLGGGYRLIALAPRGEAFLLSVPVEMNADRTTVLTRLTGDGAAAASGGGALAACARTTAPALAAALAWELPRVRAALEALLKDGLAWLDAQAAPPVFFFPAIAR
jgi:ESCRT-II complex subunit VPS22